MFSKICDRIVNRIYSLRESKIKFLIFVEVIFILLEFCVNHIVKQ